MTYLERKAKVTYTPRQKRIIHALDRAIKWELGASPFVLGATGLAWLVRHV